MVEVREQSMASPPDPIETIIQLVKLGQGIREHYKIYTRAEADLSELDSRLRSSLLVLEVFQKFIERGIGSLYYRQQQDIIQLVDQLQGVYDRYVFPTIDAKLHTKALSSGWTNNFLAFHATRN